MKQDGAPLIALEARTPAFATSEASRIAKDIFGIEGNVTLLYGERDQNFHVRSVTGDGIVLKIIGTQEDELVVDLQNAVLRHLAMADPDLPVPRVVSTISGGDYATADDADGVPHLVRAVWFQPGVPVDRIPPGPNLLRAAGRIVARLDRALQGFFHPAAAQRIVWDPRRAGALRPYVDFIEDPDLRRMVGLGLDRFLERLPQYARLRAQIIHNDCHPGNLLADPASGAITGILDFGDLIHAPVVFDAAVPAAEFEGTGLRPSESAALVIAGYAAETKLDEAELAALYDTIVARHAISLAIRAWRGRHDPAGAAKLGSVSRLNAAGLEDFLGLGPDRVAALFRSTIDSQEPAPSLTSLLDRRRRWLGEGLEVSYRNPVHAVRGDGVYLYDAEGRQFLDAYNNVPSVGHANPEVADAVAAQMRRVVSNTRYLHETVLDYAERLTATLAAGLETCLFVNSGSEANDAAWRIVKAATGRKGAIVMQAAYHGVTDAVAALSPYYGRRVEPQASHVQALEPPDLYRGRFRDADAGEHYARDADRAIAELEASGHGVAALMIDSAFVSNGIIDVPAGWLGSVVTKVRAAGGLVIADEVQSGFGRLGQAFWGFACHGILPDLVTLGKPMANGHPVGAVVTTADIMRCFTDRIEFFSTFGGNPVSAAAALATLRIIERDKLCANALSTGTMFRTAIRALMNHHEAIGNVTGSGLMIGVDIVSDRETRAPDGRRAKAIANVMRDLGVLIGTEGPHGNILKIRPPLPFRVPHAERAVAALDEALRIV